MRFLGIEVRRAATIEKASLVTDVSPLTNLSRGWTRIVESFSGAWQRNVELTTDNILTYAAVYACVTLIAQDISKLRVKLVAETSPGIWDETTNTAYSSVLRKPNHYQTRIQFLEQWVTSKLIWGNAYILKERDNRGGKDQGNITSMYVLDPQRVKVRVGVDGSVYYDLGVDTLSGLNDPLVAPAHEIIHDVMVPFYHPLCGVSPLTACGIAAIQGLSIQNNSSNLFARGLQPPGILTVASPGRIDVTEIERVQTNWAQNMAHGAVAVIGGDMKYQPLSMNAVDAQLIEQLKWTAAEVCTAFKVPAYMIGVGPAPTYNNIEALNQQYYSQCLQALIENIEVLWDEGIGLSDRLGIELDLDGLLRMDSASRVTAAKESINGGGMTANEARQRYHGLGPVVGGDAVLAQQQNYSLEALSKRDASADPFGTATPKQLPAPEPAVANPTKVISDLLRKELGVAA